jgi:hypothetical protein
VESEEPNYGITEGIRGLLLEVSAAEADRCRKVYEKEPGTPYEWLMESPDVSEECKGGLLRRRAGYNPAAINRRLNEAVGRILKLNQEKKYGEKASCLEDGRTPAA